MTSAILAAEQSGLHRDVAINRDWLEQLLESRQRLALGAVAHANVQFGEREA